MNQVFTLEVCNKFIRDVLDNGGKLSVNCMEEYAKKYKMGKAGKGKL